MATEKVYPKGIRTFKAGDKAPSFILGTIVIDVDEFQDWLRTTGREYVTQYQDKDQIKLTVLQSDKTGINIQVDTYRKEQQ